MKNKAIVILGPTASGKTALALELCKFLKAEIISLDSALIYTQMDIGTAKPTKEEMAIAPHHLINICDPKETYSAADFREDCIRLVDEISKRGHVPIICGGTMMYYKALVDGLSPVPPSTKEVRERVLSEANEHGWPYMHSLLKQFDEDSYKRLNPNDKQRISRAIEVYYMTGKPMSSFFEKSGDKCPFDRVEFILLPKDDDRTQLRALIKKRFLKMLDDGFVHEVELLRARGDLNLDMPSMRSVGYRQVFEYLEGQYDYDKMVELSVNATAHLAKHQMTWLRGSLSKDNVSKNKFRLDIGDKNNLETVLKVLKEHFDF